MRNEVTKSLLCTIFLAILLMLPSLIGDMDAFTEACVYLIVSLLFSLYLFNEYNRIGAFSRNAQEPRWKNLAILSPAFLGALTFPFAIYKSIGIMILYPEYVDWATFFINTLSICVTVFIEEVIFRLSFQRRLRIQNRGLKILASAGIFALFDIVYLFQGYPLVSVLFSMVESFLFGAILAMISEYGHNIYICMGYHFIYKFIFDGYIVDGTVASVSLCFLIVAFVYCIIIYFAYFKRKDEFYVR